MPKINLLSSAAYGYMKQHLLQKNKQFKDIEIQSLRFPDGERYFRIKDIEKIAGLPAVYICGTINDEAILEAYQICLELVRGGCTSLHLVIPYFGYSTMERATKPGEIVSAKNIACLFSSIPQAGMGNYIYTVDIHAPGTQYYFEQNIIPVNLTTEPIINNIVKDICKNNRKFVLASADMGRAKWVERISNHLGLESAYIMKKRISATETTVQALNADVKNKNVLIFDDMIRSGTSILNAARAYKTCNAKNIYAICVHGIFVKGALEKLKQSNLIKSIYCTNTHANVQNTSDNFINIYDISDIIIQGLKI
ncbi:MAG: ribose-phosphate pyrophosphokinase [Alphaproteobacteria bacterium]|nr:ribose-phosphate pyrophosphokinase [Alphaproteobacteria bacterium]